jgi:hypothetical protein
MLLAQSFACASRNLEVLANVLRAGDFERVDLTLLAVDQERLPVCLSLRRMPLC